MSSWYSCIDKEARDGSLKIAPIDFCQANGFTRCSSFHYGTRVLKKVLKSGTFSCIGWRSDEWDNPVPHIDHELIYKNPTTKECALVYLPYLEGCKEYQDEIIEWADKNGLKAMIYGDSWYNNYDPSTIVVIVTLPDVHVLATWHSPMR